MLHFETIEPETLDLLKKLQSSPAFSNLRLCDGTSLALQIGHRKSIDLDLFGNISADEYTISDSLNKLGSITILKKSKNISIYSINDIKVDIVNYSYPWIEQAIIKDNLLLASEKDIAAMKLAAIVGRGTKKDFIDLYFLLKTYALSEILEFYKRKYADGSEFLVLKSLSYFEDADQDMDPIMLNPVQWETVKEHLQSTVKTYLD